MRAWIKSHITLGERVVWTIGGLIIMGDLIHKVIT